MNVNKTTNLARVLQKYYLHKGNRIIFANKMSLNQMALAMWEQLGYHEIDASVLSRVIHGERLFTQKQLKVFCDLLKISNREKSSLKEILLSEIYKKFKLEPDFNNFSSFSSLIENLIEKIAEFRMVGKPYLASELTDILLSGIKTNIINLTFSTKTQGLFDCYAKLMLESYYNGSIFVSQKQLLSQQLPLINEAKELVKKTKNKVFIGLHYFFKGGTYYDQGKTGLSLPEIEESLKYITWPNLKLEASRQKMLNLANLHLVKRFKREFFSSEELTNNNNKKIKLGDRLALMDGVGRAQGLLKMPQALDTLDRVEKIYIKNKCQDVYRLVQLTRSRMEIISSLYPKDKNSFENIGRKGLGLAKRYGYKRYEKKISEMMNAVL